MLVAATAIIALIATGIATNPFGYADDMDLTAKLSVAIQSCAAVVVFLVVSVGRLAGHRFFTPEDIDAGAGMHGTQKAKILQSLLQNTLEQGVIATVLYLTWAVVMPGRWLSVVPLAAIAFSVGRVLFFAGYEKGAAARSLGFALTFYSSVGMLISLCTFVVIDLVK